MAKQKGRVNARGAKQSKTNANDAVATKRAARTKAINGLHDAGFEGQDAFELGEDEVRLSEQAHRRQTGRGRADADSNEDDEDEEVLALHLPEQESEEEEYSEDDDEAAEEVPAKKPKRQLNKDKDHLPLTSARTSRFDAPGSKAESAPFGSEDEEAGDSEDSVSTKADEEEEEDLAEWAKAGGYHVSKREIARAEARGDDERDERDEERDQLELYEARKIQKQSREELEEQDFGYDNADNLDNSASMEAAPDLAVRTPETRNAEGLVFADRAEAIAHLVATEPELLALLDDFNANAVRLPLVQEAVKDLQATLEGSNPKLGFAWLYHETLATYLMTLSFYFHMRSTPSQSSIDSSDLRASVLLKVVKLREALSSLDDLDLFALPGEEKRGDVYRTGADEGSDVTDGEDEDLLEEMDRDQLFSRLGDLEEDELEALLKERQALMQHEGIQPVNGKRKRIAKHDGSDDEGESSLKAQKPKAGPQTKAKCRRPAREPAAPAPILNLDTSAPIAVPKVHTPAADLDMLDATTLSTEDASEKAARKKSLRFYTSKIATQAAKRAGAGRERAGGDEDVPYRSKERARAAMLQRQQHAQAAASALDEDDFGEADLQTAREVIADPDAEGYYDLVAKGKKAAKAAKKEAYDAAVEDDRAAYELNQPLDPKSPRAVNRLIMANKGLTPKRPKSLRNPRVKKRMRYEQAKKKVASMKPVYKGGLGNAAYEGEKTGISSRVVKSRAL